MSIRTILSNAEPFNGIDEVKKFVKSKLPEVEKNIPDEGGSVRMTYYINNIDKDIYMRKVYVTIIYQYGTIYLVAYGTDRGTIRYKRGGIE